MHGRVLSVAGLDRSGLLSSCCRRRPAFPSGRIVMLSIMSGVVYLWAGEALQHAVTFSGLQRASAASGSATPLVNTRLYLESRHQHTHTHARVHASLTHSLTPSRWEDRTRSAGGALSSNWARGGGDLNRYINDGCNAKSACLGTVLKRSHAPRTAAVIYPHRAALFFLLFFPRRLLSFWACSRHHQSPKAAFKDRFIPRSPGR